MPTLTGQLMALFLSTQDHTNSFVKFLAMCSGYGQEWLRKNFESWDTKTILSKSVEGFLVIIWSLHNKKMSFCYQNCWPTVRRNCSSDREKLLKFEVIQTVKGQSNFWYQNAFLTCSWMFLIDRTIRIQIAKN